MDVTLHRQQGGSLLIWYSRRGRSRYDRMFWDTSSVISSSWVGDNRYFVFFRSESWKSCAVVLARCHSPCRLTWRQLTSPLTLCKRPLLAHSFSDEMDDKETREQPIAFICLSTTASILSWTRRPSGSMWKTPECAWRKKPARTSFACDSDGRFRFKVCFETTSCVD